MLELSWTEPTIGIMLLFNIVFLLYVIIYYRKFVVRPIWGKKRPSMDLVFFSILLIIILSANGSSDWYHYQSMVWNYDFTIGAHNHGEPVYGYIIQFVNKNYLLFRIIVWGGALLLCLLSFKRLDINPNVALFFLVTVYLFKFNYARASLGMSSYFFGLSYLLNPTKKRLFNVIIIGLSFWGAYEFHHSMLPVILFTIAALLPIDRPFVAVLAIAAMPIIASYVFSNLSILEQIGEEDLFGKASRYMAKESEGANFFGKIYNVIKYGAFVLPLVVDNIVIRKNLSNVPLRMKRLLRITLAIVLFAVMFLFMNLSNEVFTYRYLYMTLIPLTILTVYLYQNGLLTKKFFSLIVLWGIGANVYDLLYGLYKNL